MKLKFIGNGSEKIIENIKHQFKKEGLESYLEIVDLLSLKDLAKEFNKADLVVFPDGTSLSCIEAASCNTAVLMADLPASLEREKGIGSTYSRGDIHDLANKISYLLNDRKNSILYPFPRVKMQEVNILMMKFQKFVSFV